MKKILLVLCILLFSTIMMQSNAQTSATVDTSRYLKMSLISQTPDPATAGQTVDFKFMAENLGGQEINNLQVEFVPSFPFTALSGETYNRTITTLGAFQQGNDAIIFKFKVAIDKDAIEGTSQVKLRETMPGISYDQLFNVDITGQRFAQIIYIDKSKLQPGNETQVTFTISNTGNSPLQNLVFSWNEENSAILPVYSDNTKYVKYLDVGKSIDLPYIVVANVNTPAGLYQLNLDLKFQTSDGSSQEINTKTGITVGGETDFDVAFSESSQGQTSISIANTGNNPAYSVTVSIPPQPGFTISGSQSSIIGNLDKGDYTLASFQVTQSASASNFTRQVQTAGGSRGVRNITGEQQFSQSGGNQLQVRIDYTDTTGMRHSVLKYVPIQFRAATTTTTTGTTQQGQLTRQRGSFWTSTTAIVIYLVVIGGVAGFIYLRRKNKSKNQLLLKRKKE
jgi:hypothetical protein